MAFPKIPSWWPTEEWTEVDLIGQPDGPKEKEGRTYYRQECYVNGRKHNWWPDPKERESYSGFEEQRGLSFRKIKGRTEVKGGTEPVESRQAPPSEAREAPPRASAPQAGSLYLERENALRRIRQRMEWHGYTDDDLRAMTATLFIAWDRTSGKLTDIPTVSDSEEARNEAQAADGDDIPF